MFPRFFLGGILLGRSHCKRLYPPRSHCKSEVTARGYTHRRELEKTRLGEDSARRGFGEDSEDSARIRRGFGEDSARIRRTRRGFGEDSEDSEDSASEDSARTQRTRRGFSEDSARTRRTQRGFGEDSEDSAGIRRGVGGLAYLLTYLLYTYLLTDCRRR